MKILLTGGSACGKSTMGEKLALSGPGPHWYIATMRVYGEEGRRKVERHRRLRAGKGFETIERYTDLAGLRLPERGGTALLECICNLTANEMFDEQGRECDPMEKVLSGVRNLAEQCRELIVITNDVGSSWDDYSGSTRRYVESLGRINMHLAADFDGVYELVCGIPLTLKGAAL